MNFKIERRQLGRGLLVLVFMTLIGMGYVFWTTSSEETFAALGRLRIDYLLLLIGLTFLDFWLGGIRNHIFIRRIKPGTSSWVSFRANLANIFLGAVTPSQTGGGAAQLYIFYRAGVPMSGAIATSVFNYLATLTFFIFTVAAILQFSLTEVRFSTGIQIFIGYSFAVFCSFFTLFLVTLAKPQWLGRFMAAINRKSHHAESKIALRFFAILEKLLNGFDAYRQHATYFLGEARRTIGLSLILTILLYWNKYNLAYFVIRGIGQPCDYVNVIFLQNIQLFLLYFSPTPGASGIAEISAASLMKSQVTLANMAAFAVLWRTFTIYAAVVAGAIVLWRETKSISSDISRTDSEPVPVEGA